MQRGDSRVLFVTVGMDFGLLRELFDRVAAASDHRFCHIMRPDLGPADVPGDFPVGRSSNDLRFMMFPRDVEMPEPDIPFLASLERHGVPTVHNMILGDRHVAKLPYDEALRYATLLARRYEQLFFELKPDAVLSGFDGLYAGIAMGVAKRMGIPWFAFHFSVIPPGLACFCEAMNPASRVALGDRPTAEPRSWASEALKSFEDRKITAAAYLPPAPRSAVQHLRSLPARLRTLWKILRRSDSEGRRFSEHPSNHSAIAALQYLWRARAARRALESFPKISAPPQQPYVLFGLHMQPESSIDVWAPFFSNQMWVIELLARAIPVSHRLLVKIHKSDVTSYSRDQLRHMTSLPGVVLITPTADTRRFIEEAALVIGIQGTMGLEAALLGKPVIMLGKSPVTCFPTASPVGPLEELPALIARKLAEPRPKRDETLAAYLRYLEPFTAASLNDWSVSRTEAEIAGYVTLFRKLASAVTRGAP